MIEKGIYSEHVACIESCVHMYNMDESILVKLQSIANEIKDYEVRVLFVGRFNSGKSALINALIKRDLLTEEQSPETAIATEIKNGYPERVELKDAKNYCAKICDIEEIKDVNPEKYMNYEYYIKNSILEELSDYTLVDMPGYDSGVKRHNKALSQYIGKGVAFILVVDCENGTLHQSDKDFLKELKLYNNNIFIAINKTDKRVDAKDIIEIISKEAENIFDTAVPIIATSKYDESSSQRILIALSHFDSQTLFQQSFDQKIIDLLFVIKTTLESILSTETRDLSSIENEIKNYEETNKILKDELQTERKRLAKNLQSKAKEAILSDLNIALLLNSTVLASAAKNGNENFTKAVNNCIRPILISSTQKYAEIEYNNFIDTIEFKSVDTATNDAVHNAVKSLEAINGKLKEASGLLLKVTDSSNNIKYKTIVGTLAATTAIVAPWLEIVILFLPEILTLLRGIFGANKEEELREKIESDIVPQIISKMTPEIENLLKTIENEMMEELEAKYIRLLDANNTGLIEAKKIKEDKTKEFDEYYSAIKTNLINVQNQIKGINNRL